MVISVYGISPRESLSPLHEAFAVGGPAQLVLAINGVHIAVGDVEAFDFAEEGLRLTVKHPAPKVRPGEKLPVVE